MVTKWTTREKLRWTEQNQKTTFAKNKAIH